MEIEFYDAYFVGVWFMHSHLEGHTSWGMSTVLIVRSGTTEETG